MDVADGEHISPLRGVEPVFLGRPAGSFVTILTELSRRLNAYCKGMVGNDTEGRAKSLENQMLEKEISSLHNRPLTVFLVYSLLLAI